MPELNRGVITSTHLTPSSLNTKSRGALAGFKYRNRTEPRGAAETTREESWRGAGGWRLRLMWRARSWLLLTLARATHAWHEDHFVSGLEHLLSAPSYAGLLPVGNGNATELFYWLFLAQNRKPNAPVVVWMNGGPGLSSMFGLFNELGPLQLDGQDKLQPRLMHWNEQWHLLFVDQPLGVGFSEYGAAGPSHSLRDTTAQLYGVLQALLVRVS